MAAAAEAALEIALEAALVVAVRFGKKKGTPICASGPLVDCS